MHVPPAIPPRSAPALPQRGVLTQQKEERRLPPLPPNGLRPQVREPPARREIPEMSFYDQCESKRRHSTAKSTHDWSSLSASSPSQANMDLKPKQATAMLNRYIATPENRAQASSLYDKVNEKTQQTLTRERKEKLAKSMENVGAAGYSLFNKIKKSARE